MTKNLAAAQPNRARASSGDEEGGSAATRTEVRSPSEEEMLNRLWMKRDGKNIMAGIIRGRWKNPCISEEHTIVTGENGDRRTHRLMDHLYNVYRADLTTADGCCQIPWISTLRREDSSEFHIYAEENGVVKGFFASFLPKYQYVGRVPTMTFVWVVPRFRRQGLFTRMFNDLLHHRGPFFVDRPNAACEVALRSFGYSDEKVVRHYEETRQLLGQPSSV